MCERKERPRVVLVTRSIVLNDKDEILLLKRKNQPEKFAASLWEVPGGKVEEGQDIGHATEIEVLQETGLIVKPLTHLSFCHSEIISGGKYSGLLYVVLVGISGVESGTVSLENNPDDEHVDFKWVPRNDVMAFDLKQDIRAAFTVLLPVIEKLSRQDR